MGNLGAAMRQSLQRVKAACRYCETQACPPLAHRDSRYYGDVAKW